MTSSVQDMLAEIKTSQNKFDEFWRIHRSRVEHMMRMCHFSRSGEKVYLSCCSTTTSMCMYLLLLSVYVIDYYTYCDSRAIHVLLWLKV